MLNERQKKIILFLESQTQPITARQLAEKFHTSLRTIRYDIHTISEFCKDHTIEFLRSPNIGLSIQSQRPVAEFFTEGYDRENFYYLKEEGRTTLLLLCFLMKQNPLTLGELEHYFSVSKNTIRTILDICSDQLKSFDLDITGKKNRGFTFTGSIKGILTFFAKTMSRNGSDILYNTLMNPDNQLIPTNLKQQIELIINYLSESLHLLITDYQRLAFSLTLLLRQLQLTAHSSLITHCPESELSPLVRYIENLCKVQFDRDSEEILIPILNQSTDYSERYFATLGDEYLVHSIHNMIQILRQDYQYLIDDEDLLKTDLFKHLKTTIENLKMGFSNENPLLETIKTTYQKEYEAVFDAARELALIHPELLNENEIGFLTLYFCRSFDKAKEIQKSRIMVVCNTGRSASKLLATRLINNLPGIHIVAIASIYDIQTNKTLLEHIDFIISTLPLHNVHKPYIVVSPLLQNAEIELVKEAIWDRGNEKDDMIQYENKAEIPWIGGILESLLNKPEISEFYAGICMDLFSLIQQLYPKGLNKSNYNNVAGIFAHTLISIPRWKSQDYIRAEDAEELFQIYQKETASISEFLHTISTKLDIRIPLIEAAAILRYYSFTNYLP